MIEQIYDPDLKKTVAREILEALREWFEVDESRKKYIADCEGWIKGSRKICGVPVSEGNRQGNGRAGSHGRTQGGTPEGHRQRTLQSCKEGSQGERLLIHAGKDGEDGSL